MSDPLVKWLICLFVAVIALVIWALVEDYREYKRIYSEARMRRIIFQEDGKPLCYEDDDDQGLASTNSGLRPEYRSARPREGYDR